MSRVSLLSTEKISPQTTRLPISKAASRKGVILPRGTWPSTALAVSGMMVGSRCSSSRTLTCRRLARSCKASSYSSISRTSASRWRRTCSLRAFSTKVPSPASTESLPANSTAQETWNHSWIRLSSLAPVFRAAKSS